MNKYINHVSAASDFNLPCIDVINYVVTKCFLYTFGIHSEQLSLLMNFLKIYEFLFWLLKLAHFLYQQFFFNKAYPFIISVRVCQLGTGAFLTSFSYLEQVEHCFWWSLSSSRSTWWWTWPWKAERVEPYVVAVLVFFLPNMITRLVSTT